MVRLYDGKTLMMMVVVLLKRDWFINKYELDIKNSSLSLSNEFSTFYPDIKFTHCLQRFTIRTDTQRKVEELKHNFSMRYDMI